MTKLLRIELTAPADLAEEIAAFLASVAPHGWAEEEDAAGRVRFSVHYRNRDAGREAAEAIGRRWPDLAPLLSEVEEEDWTVSWKEFFTPVLAGKSFVVLPPWLAGEVPPGRMAVVIHPGTAFGTGHHATTALCLAAISDLKDAGRLDPGLPFLDLGTGSGILGLACARLGLSGLGLDNDPEALANAIGNVRANGAEGAFTLVLGSTECLAPGARFGLVLANILAGPLVELAPELVSRLAPGGCLVLSGILTEQAPAMAAAYAAQGLGTPREMISGEWSALVYAPPACLSL